MKAETKENGFAEISSELDEPRWSVMSFDECAASGLTYEEATKLLQQMTNDLPGLCIVTDEAAQRIYGAKNVPVTSNSTSADFPAPATFSDIL
jgi:hypothetical protein